MNSYDAHQNAGVFTWTLRGGRWNYRQEPVDTTVFNLTCHGWYDIDGAHAIFATTSEPGFGTCARHSGPHTGSSETAPSPGAPSTRPTTPTSPEPWQKIG